MNAISSSVLRVVLFLGLSAPVFSIGGVSLEPTGIFEALPPELQQRVASADEPLRQAGDLVPFYVITRWKKWEPAQTLRIAFIGGNSALHKRIATIASQWTQHANLKFDFGYDEASGAYRTLGPDTEAEIRISFNQAGYWSLVGTDSIDRRIRSMSESSMNFSRFDTAPPPAPEFDRVVLHEFGHALGLQHEHQNPEGHCDSEFDWPKVRTYLRGPPNSWTDAQIDFNLKQLSRSSAYDASSPDRLSIMFYHFEPWMFINGAESPCCVPNNTTLSDFDRQAVARMYPAIAAPTNARLRIELSQALAEPKLASPALRKAMSDKLRVLADPSK